LTTPELHDLIERTRIMVERLQEATTENTRIANQSMVSIHEAKEVAEHARATSEGNERIFRTLMNNVRRQNDRFDQVEARVTRLEDPTKGAA